MHFILLLRCFGRNAGGLHGIFPRILVLGHEICLGADGERLNRNAQNAAASRGRNLGGRREAWAQVRGRIGEGHHDLEILGFLAGRGGLRGGDTGRAHDRVVSDFADDAVEDFARDGVDGHVRGLAETHVDDVGLIHLDLGRDHGHVGQRHQRAAGRVLDSDDHGLAFAHGEIGDHAVKGRFVSGLLQHVGNTSQVRLILSDVLVARVFLRLGLRHTSLCLGQPGIGGLPRRFLDVVILLGDEGRVVQTLGAVPVELGVDGVGLGPVQIRERGLQGGIGGDRVGLRCLHGRPRGIDVGRRLHVLKLRQ